MYIKRMTKNKIEKDMRKRWDELAGKGWLKLTSIEIQELKQITNKLIESEKEEGFIK